jgi:transcriptional regulator with XRE-family HTH domain
MGSRSCQDNHVASIRRQTWGRMFGWGIAQARNNAGLSIEQAAEAAGIEAAEWRAVEGGQVPTDQDRLLAIAEAVHFRQDQIALWVLMCGEAWQR